MVLTFSFGYDCFLDRLHAGSLVALWNSCGSSSNIQQKFIFMAIWCVYRWNRCCCRQNEFSTPIETKNSWNSIEFGLAAIVVAIVFGSSAKLFHHVSIKVYCSRLCGLIDWAQIHIYIYWRAGALLSIQHSAALFGHRMIWACLCEYSHLYRRSIDWCEKCAAMFNAHFSCSRTIYRKFSYL